MRRGHGGGIAGVVHGADLLLQVDAASNEIVVLDRHDYTTDKDGNIIKEIYHGHVQSSYPSDSITEGDLNKLKRAGMINNTKKQRVLPPKCDG
ncbi:hypothetical protein ABTY98_12545 [Streptomyces sp. NPDC096040]|uniref:hypothetical protein n=1 Tax=Streptomyces sp. NPDC096040 TaxID=3155541 RepID=UPI0033322D4F